MCERASKEIEKVYQRRAKTNVLQSFWLSVFVLSCTPRNKKDAKIWERSTTHNKFVCVSVRKFQPIRELLIYYIVEWSER